VRSRFIVALAVAALSLSAAGVAMARNPHCAGGMQYVSQGLRDKEKGNTEDYQREFSKAIDQLSQCAGEDVADYEAVGYLGWAYAEVDSAGPAGEWFAKAVAGAESKADKKKLDIIVANRDHYWSIDFNDGIKNIQDAQQFTDAGAKDEAAKAFASAIDRLTRASLLRPGHPSTLRNLATAYALAGNNDAAENVLRIGLTQSSADTSAHILAEALRTVRANKAQALVEAKKYDEAITYYNELTKQEPGNADLWRGLADAIYSRAGAKQDAARRADFKAAGDAYAHAFTVKPTDTNLAFNAALSYTNAVEPGLAEAQWRAVIKNTPNDADALSSLGSVLADEKKFDEAQQVLERAIEIKPDEKVYFRQLAAVFSKQGNNPKSTEMMFVYLPMANGTARADAAGALKSAKAGTAAASTGSAMGAPEKVFDWTDNTAGALQTWVYTTKRQAFTFNGAGALVQKSAWGAKK
jgi:tetratricopeptide (TPR) repeat protein